jgi:hypothetical protein
MVLDLNYRVELSVISKLESKKREEGLGKD